MGLIRKTMSIGTAGLVDFRSDKERTARSTRQTAHEAKEQTKLMQQQLELQQQQMLQSQAAAAQASIAATAAPTPVAGLAPVAMAPGWYQVDGQTRYWDGAKFADVTPAG